MKNLTIKLVTLLAALSPFLIAAAEHPNIILILVDDLGHADVGFNRIQQSRGVSTGSHRAAPQ